MNLFNKIVRRKDTTVAIILAKDDVRQLVDAFAKEHLQHCTGLIMIWKTAEGCGGDSVGFAEDEAYWALHKMSHRFMKD